MIILRSLRHAAVAVGGAACAISGWAAAPATLADCNQAAPSTLLAAPPAADATPAHARAVWLDGVLIRWPGAAPGGRYRLHHSAAAQMIVKPGAPVQGADGAITLEAWTGPLPPAVAQRFAHVAAGATVAVTPSDALRLRPLLRQQTVLVREDDAGRVLDATGLQAPGALDTLFAPAAALRDFGGRIVRERQLVPPGRDVQTRWRLWAPTAQRVAVCLHPDDTAPAETLLPMVRDAATGSWHTQRAGSLAGRSYTYLVDVVVPGHGLVRNRVTDPYALSLSPGSTRTTLVDLASRSLQPAGWDTAPRPQRVQAPTDLVIYELHVRDFSASDASVNAAHRGKYAAFTETASQGMTHLRRLAEAGVTDVHLLPVFDLATVPETGCVTPRPEGPPDGTQQQAAVAASAALDCYNWGYDPLHFTGPEGSFASEGASGAQRIVEFRRMVQALHRLGLRVGMDVVYNHTSASGQHPNSVLDRIVPGYYQRLDADGRVERSTCCDNTATEHLMMGKLMIDSVVTWARDHRIDSFRFDQMGHQPRAVMEQLQRAVNAAAGRHVHLIGEGWNFGEVADGRRFVQASQLSLGGSGIATFSDRARDAVRGGGAGDDGVAQIERQGYVNGLHFAPNDRAAGKTTPADLMRAADLVRVGLAGSLRSFTMIDHRGTTVPLEGIDYAGQPAGYVGEPGEVVNYVENHDNQTLFDANVFKLPAGTNREDRARVQHLANAINAFSQGIAYFHAGQELLRSKSMDRNSYDSGDWFNRIDWSAQDNHFGSGLPPQRDNGTSWPLMQPLLADASIKPAPADIAWTRDAFFDLLRIRSSTTLLRLRSAADIRARLHFANTGPQQVPTVLAAHLDGRGLDGAGFAELAYFINVDTVAQRIIDPAWRDKAFELHPVLAAAGAADARAKAAAYDRSAGAITVPPRTAVVFVVR